MKSRQSTNGLNIERLKEEIIEVIKNNPYNNEYILFDESDRGLIVFNNPIHSIFREMIPNDIRNKIKIITVQSGIISISDGALEGMENLEKIEAIDISYIGSNALRNCANLNDFYLPNIERIDYGAFSNTALSGRIALPDKLSSLGDNVFSGCHGITNVLLEGEIPENFANAFTGCDNLSIVEIKSHLKTKDSAALDKINHGHHRTLRVIDEAYQIIYSAIDSLQEPQTYNIMIYQSNAAAKRDDKSILFRAVEVGFADKGEEKICVPLSFMSGNKIIEKVYFYGDVLVIGHDAFRDCKNLKYVKIAAPHEIYTVGAYAFANTAIETIYFPRCVGYCEGVFADCHKLRRIKVDRSSEKMFEIAARNIFGEDNLDAYIRSKNISANGGPTVYLVEHNIVEAYINDFKVLRRSTNKYGFSKDDKKTSIPFTLPGFEGKNIRLVNPKSYKKKYGFIK